MFENGDHRESTTIPSALLMTNLNCILHNHDTLEKYQVNLKRLHDRSNTRLENMAY